MFSSSEYQFIHDLTLNFYNNDYKSYLCVTHNPSNSYNTSYYDVICYYSKDKLSLNNYTLSVPSSSKRCDFDSKNATSNSKSSSSLICTDYSGTVNIDTKEFVYSNVGFNSNIIADYETSLNNKLDLNYAFFICFALILPVVVGFVHHFFRID